jgi:hypothetical protein
MTPLDSHDLMRSDAPIRYWTGGTAAGPTALLLHGATPDYRSWSLQAQALQDGSGWWSPICAAMASPPDLRLHRRDEHVGGTAAPSTPSRTTQPDRATGHRWQLARECQLRKT